MVPIIALVRTLHGSLFTDGAHALGRAYLALQAVQILDGTLRVCRRREDGARIGPQHAQPTGQVGGVILAWLWRHTEIRTQEGSAELCDQLFAGVTRITEA